MTEMTLSIPEIHCNHCKKSIEGAVTALDGIQKAEVDVANAVLTFSFDEPATLGDVVAAIEGQGYEVPSQG